MDEFTNQPGPKKFYVKSVYGQDLMYWYDNKDQEHWKKLTGHKTITDKDIELMAVMFGTQFEQVLPPKY